MMENRYLAGVAALSVVPVDFEAAIHHLEEASKLMEATMKEAKESSADHSEVCIFSMRHFPSPLL